MELHKLAYTQDADTGKFILFEEIGGRDVEVIKASDLESILDVIASNYEQVGATTDYGVYIAI